MEELIGFVLGSKPRGKAMELLESKGAMPSKKVAKFGHMTKPTIERALKETAEKGLVEESDDQWKLTDLGLEVQKELKKRT